MNATIVLIDTDCSIGLPQRDVDDALAIVMALNSPELVVDAITLTYGNDSLDNVENCMKVLNKFLEYPQNRIASGAKSPEDLGLQTNASEMIVNRTEKGPLTILALGPLTNIASAVKRCPTITDNISEIVMVAGRRPGQRFITGNHPLSHPDLNFEKDPGAAGYLLEQNVPIVLAPFEVSSKVWITREILELIRSNRTLLSAFLYEHSLSWMKFWQKSFSTPDTPVIGFNPFDCLAVAWLTDRILLSHQSTRLVIEESDLDPSDRNFQGTTSLKPLLHAYPVSSRSTPSSQTYIHDVRAEEFLKNLIARLR